MSTIAPLMPAQPVPDLSVATTDGGTWRLSARNPKNFSLIVVYRGLHCPICKKYLLQFQDSLGDFAERGVDPGDPWCEPPRLIAVSCHASSCREVLSEATTGV